MKKVNRNNDRAAHAGRAPMPWQRRLSQLIVLAMFSVLLMPGVASAKKPVKSQPVASEAGCVILPPAYIDTGHAFTLKIVRDPSYTGVWSQPIVEADAVFSKTDGGNVVSSFTETTSRYGYGVTYVTANLLAPSCNGVPCDIDTGAGADITAVIKEPINKGKRFRETVCKPVTANVNPAM